MYWRLYVCDGRAHLPDAYKFVDPPLQPEYKPTPNIPPSQDPQSIPQLDPSGSWPPPQSSSQRHNTDNERNDWEW